MNLEDTWENCLKMWKWISEQEQNYDVILNKKIWLEENGFNLYEIWSLCFFCDYAHKEGISCYHSCPGKLVDKKFNCYNRSYHYRDEPKKFYEKIKELNEIRLKGKQMNYDERIKQCNKDIEVLQKEKGILLTQKKKEEKKKDSLYEIKEYIRVNKVRGFCTADIVENKLYWSGTHFVRVPLPKCNESWTFAAFDWVKAFCKEFDGKNRAVYPVHYKELDNPKYLYICLGELR